VAWRYVTAEYFHALKIPIVHGRGFANSDRAQGDAPVILSQSLARRLFPGADPLNKRIQLGDWYTVVGVAADVRNQGPQVAPDPEYYVLRRPIADASWTNQPSGWRHAFVVIRSTLDKESTAAWIQKRLGSLDPTLPVRVDTMESRVETVIQRPRFNAFLLSLFGGVGLMLAAIGLYGVMAFLVGQRTQEIGVRMALGARPGNIATMVLTSAWRWMAVGVVAGLGGAFFVNRLLKSLLFQIPPRDPWSWAVAVLALLIVGTLAAWLPSRRAAAADPAAALRQD